MILIRNLQWQRAVCRIFSWTQRMFSPKRISVYYVCFAYWKYLYFLPVTAIQRQVAAFSSDEFLTSNNLHHNLSGHNKVIMNWAECSRFFIAPRFKNFISQETRTKI